ncbi:MAG: AhpC/TSA family protein [Ardenticatenaceae bacterium]|nr:AhpC/TSA family protein [Anaerolineales bacterium]MCB8923517.1 AhpC/TSA family protein [Ardenticatenaceae bacterium]MCB8991912.1 AhpC/TSA family protein [Ardenticatenaceae bacterium]MCB9003758.1 AhpC/TSA family protein [Ardenticatenaceae bacterium]
MLHQNTLQTLNTEVITISFGATHWAQMWLQETQSPFPFLVDTERAAYHAYGLKSSIISSWSFNNLWYYAKAVRQGRETFGKRGNPHQLGGDFIVDKQGILRLTHPSREPTDRPSVNKLLETLQNLQ